jgi:uncharacterized SAM-binding protein YcdF (DUF218 family)
MRRRAARLTAGAAIAGMVWFAGLMWFAAAVPDRVADTTTHTDAIVVLTGGSGRLAAGMALLKRGLSDRLFISGVHRGVDKAEILRVAHAGAHSGLAPEVALGYSADDTRGNAAETAAWIFGRPIHSLRLVTAAYHMPRALWEFHAAMPGIAIIPNPVFPRNVKTRHWWLWPGTAALFVTEYSKYLAAVLRHSLSLG